MVVPVEAKQGPGGSATAIRTDTSPRNIEEILGDDARDLLEHRCETFPASQLHQPGPDFVNRVWSLSDRPTPVLRSLQTLLDHGHLGGTGYLAILPVDQGVEHSAGASFAIATGENDLKDAVRTAVINRRAGGMGLISGRKAFQRPTREGITLLQGIQDVYLSKEISLA